jgi:hypothetical protein
MNRKSDYIRGLAYALLLLVFVVALTQCGAW